jgi:hypothetical protein
MTKELYDKPSEVIADDGKVLVDGPDGFDAGRRARNSRSAYQASYGSSWPGTLKADRPSSEVSPRQNLG